MNKRSATVGFHIRTMGPGDAEAVDRVFDAMSPEARFFRYLRAMPRLTDGARNALANVDGTRHFARVAEADGEPVGIARVVKDAEGSAELAIEIADPHTGRGLGRALTRCVLDDAAARGITEVELLLHPDNHRAVRLFRSFGARFVYDGGLLSGRMPTRRIEELAS